MHLTGVRVGGGNFGILYYIVLNVVSDRKLVFRVTAVYGGARRTFVCIPDHGS